MIFDIIIIFEVIIVVFYGRVTYPIMSVDGFVSHVAKAPVATISTNQ